MREFARAFYKGKAWRSCSRGYMQSRNYVCERCGGVAVICHHKTYLTPKNINDPTITLNWANLEALCQDCHNREHMQKYNKTYFADDGSIERVKEGREINDFKGAAAELTALLEEMKP